MIKVLQVHQGQTRRMESRKLCQVCRHLNLKPDTFLQTGWRYPTSLHYESLTEWLNSSESEEVSQNNHYVPGEKLEDVLQLSDDDPHLDRKINTAPPVTHLTVDEFIHYLHTKLPAPLLHHVFDEAGDPEQTVPVKSRDLGLLREVSQRANDGCSLCKLVMHASWIMTKSAVNTEKSIDDTMCKIRFNFRDIEVEAEHDAENRTPRDTSTILQTLEASLHNDSVVNAQCNRYYECSISCGSSSMSVSPVFLDNSDFTWFGGRQIGPTADFSLVKQWLSSCDMLHTMCSQKIDHLDLDSLKQVRVVDIEQGRLVDIVASGPRFLALSYVWGDVPTLKLTKNNLTDLQQPGAITTRSSQIPKTITDTFHVARQLDLRYVWVDSLCVLQNDSVEMTPELRQMDLIYAAAYLTVVAADGIDAGVGLPGSTAERPRQVPYMTEYDEKLSLMLDPKPLHDVLSDCPWSQRMWTLQEALMSRRLLLFTEQGLHFTCSSLSWSENLKSPSETTCPPWRQVRENAYYFRSQIVDKSAGSSSLENDATHMDLWVTTIMDVSERKLKYEWDVGDATAGLMIQLEMHYNTINRYGLPEIALTNFLLWGPMDSGRLVRRRPKTGGEPYPTWTWMGWVGQVSWFGGDVQDDDSFTEAIDFGIWKLSTVEGAPEPLRQPEIFRPRSRRRPCRYLHLTTRNITLHVQRCPEASERIRELQTYAWSVVSPNDEAKNGVHVVSLLSATGSYVQVGSVVFDSLDDCAGEDDFDCLFVQIGSKPQTMDVGVRAGQLFVNVLALKQIRVLRGGEVVAERIGHGRVLVEETRSMWKDTVTILQ